MINPENSDTYAAVDLGSNSFHLVVARKQHGELRYLDRIREMVRLGGGLNQEGFLDPEVQQRALECLARFGQRLRGIPNANIRAVGTQTLRRMHNSNAFVMVAETALDCPVDIISGREEARLVYLGVSQGVSGHEDRRLVIDVGGGSTELVIGEGLNPLETESLQFGCVSVTRQFFKSGRISRRKFEKARRAVLVEMQELQAIFRRTGWQIAFGSSGTIRAIATISQSRGWSEDAITRDALGRLVKETLGFRHIEEVDLEGLSAKRHPVFIGGLAIVSACFEALGIEQLNVSTYALREGVLYDLLGRIDHLDPRDQTVQAFQARYSVDPEQVRRIRRIALTIFDGIDIEEFDSQTTREMLGWAADLHETGLSISHSNYHLHSGYLVEASDMAGFTQTEQLFLSLLVRYHRRAVPKNYSITLPTRLHYPLAVLMFCLRLACILCRTRDDQALPVFQVRRRDHDFLVCFDAIWAMAHPLTLADLEQERTDLEVAGIGLDISLGQETSG